MPAFMTNKWFLLALGVALGVALDYKFGLASKTGMASILGAPSA